MENAGDILEKYDITWPSLKEGTGNGGVGMGMENEERERGTGNGERGSLKGESLKAGIFKSGNL